LRHAGRDAGVSGAIASIVFRAPEPKEHHMRQFTRLGLPLAAALLSLSGAAHAVIIPGVYNTGLGVGGIALAAGDGQTDANYVVVSSDAPGVVAGSSALTYYNPAYLMDGPLSRIVNALGDGTGSAGTTTTFATTFSMLGWDIATASISGQALFDNLGEIFLNGNQIGGTITGFSTLTPFGTSSNFFLGGLNTLTFVLHNEGGPEAFQVAGLTVTAAPLAAVPEPAAWALMIGGFAMTGSAMRRRSKMTVVSA
jgi:hypothetical protein